MADTHRAPDASSGSDGASGTPEGDEVRHLRREIDALRAGELPMEGPSKPLLLRLPCSRFSPAAGPYVGARRAIFFKIYKFLRSQCGGADSVSNSATLSASFRRPAACGRAARAGGELWRARRAARRGRGARAMGAGRAAAGPARYGVCARASATIALPARVSAAPRMPCAQCVCAHSEKG